MSIQLLLTNCAQIVTCRGSQKPLRGQEMQALVIIENGAIAIDEGKIAAVGPVEEIVAKYVAVEVLDCRGRAVIPGFVDCHTHTVFGGDRVNEFEMRIGGASYMEIMAAGGGILSTMRQTREADEDALFSLAKARLDAMLALGSTTVEIKTGYGLDLPTELKMLRVIERLADAHPCTIVPTFLGAHTVPPEFQDEPEGYVRLVIEAMLPAVWSWYEESTFARKKIPLFCDVFCEDHAFNVAQSAKILARARELGFKLKIHVDQFNELGGLEMALALGAVSVDHLDVTGEKSMAGLAQMHTVAVPLPAANFNLGHTHFANARKMIDQGVALALATDLNPGSAPCYSMPLVMAVANRYQRLLPAETLHAATINAAHALDLADRAGSIEVGKQADLLMLQTADYRHLSYFLGGNPVQQVIKGGHLVES